MAAQVLQLDELATPIATYLVTISPRSAVTLAQTYRFLEVPALSALWGIQSSINLLISSVSPVDACRYSSGYGVVGRPLIPRKVARSITKKPDRSYQDYSLCWN